MSFFRVLLSLTLGCFVGLSALPARADSFPPLLPPSYAVSGALLIVGSNACGVPCTETVAFSFDVGWQVMGTNSYMAYYTDLRSQGSGALGSFSERIAGPGFFDLEMNHLGVTAAPVDEIDINILNLFSTAPVAPAFPNQAYLWSCATTTCLKDFAPWLLPEGAPQFGIFVYGPAEFKVTAIPEPATLTLLFSGILLVGLGAAISRKF